MSIDLQPGRDHHSSETLSEEYITAVVDSYESTYGEVLTDGLPVIDDRNSHIDIVANPDSNCPPEVLAEQRAVDLIYYSYDGRLHIGRMEVNKEVVDEIKTLFAFLLKNEFPVEKVVVASDEGWDDSTLMDHNCSSSFNYRNIPEKPTLSAHALGLAIDINARDMPYIYTKQNGEIVSDPEGAVYDPQNPRALTSDHEAVKLMEQLGWEWGGNWTIEEHGMIDYQHFEKKLTPSLNSERVKQLGLTGFTVVGMLNTIES